MRKIKFRAKMVDFDGWVYGHYVNCRYKHKLETGHFVIKYPDKQYEIYTETLGQFTGLHDKNGKEIYEGDIIQGKYNLVLIKWGRTAFLPYRNQNGSFSKVTNWASVEKGEIIGNIYENPQMLEVEK